MAASSKTRRTLALLEALAPTHPQLAWIGSTARLRHGQRLYHRAVCPTCGGGTADNVYCPSSFHTDRTKG